MRESDMMPMAFQRGQRVFARSTFGEISGTVQRVEGDKVFIVKDDGEMDVYRAGELRADSEGHAGAMAGNMRDIKQGIKGFFTGKESVEEEFNPTDSVSMDVPLMIRIMEYAREDAKTDMALHDVAENLIRLSNEGRTLTMDDYDAIVGSVEQDRPVGQEGMTETALQGKEDLEAKRQALQDLEREPGADQEAIRQRKLDLEREARAQGVAEGSLAEKINPKTLTRGFRQEKDMGWYTLQAVGDFASRMADEPPTMEIYAMLKPEAGKRDGKQIGQLSLKIAQGMFLKDNPGAEALVAGGVDVDPAYQRKGVASAMYAFAKELGNDVIASVDQSDDAKAMWAGMRAKGVAEGLDDNPVASAITRRIMLQRTDLLAKHGPQKVVAAIDEVADFVGDVDEIGSSDVSGWVKHVEQMLGNMNEQGVAEVAPKGWEGTVKAMKKHGEVDNPYALTNYMKNKGYHSHKTKSGKDKRESAEPAPFIKRVAEGRKVTYSVHNALGECVLDGLSRDAAALKLQDLREGK
jgi:GNAT superfamily N-acetyltransferase